MLLCLIIYKIFYILFNLANILFYGGNNTTLQLQIWCDAIGSKRVRSIVILSRSVSIYSDEKTEDYLTRPRGLFLLVPVKLF